MADFARPVIELLLLVPMREARTLLISLLLMPKNADWVLQEHL